MMDANAIAAKLGNSPRLRRIFDFLRARGEIGATTREIIAKANVCAVNSAVDELRDKGFEIDCRYERESDGGARVYRYVLVGAEGDQVQGDLFR